MVWGVLGVFLHQLALRLGSIACVSAGVFLSCNSSLAQPNPVPEDNSSIGSAQFLQPKQNTRPVPPSPPQSDPGATYSQRELQQLILVLREIQRLGLRPQRSQELENLIRELERLEARGQAQVVLSSEQARQVQAILSSLSRDEILQIQESLDLPEVEVGVFSQEEVQRLLLILGGIQQLGLRPEQSDRIDRLIDELETLQASGQPQVILPPEQTQQVTALLASLTPAELAQIEDAVGVPLTVGNRQVTQEGLEDLLSLLQAVQRLNLRPQQRTELATLIRDLERLQAEGDAVVELSEAQAEQIQSLIGSLSVEELARLEREVPGLPTPRKFTQQEVSELLDILRSARDLEDLTGQQARQVQQLIEVLEVQQATGEPEVILSGQQVQTLDRLIDSFSRNQIRVLTRELGIPTSFPLISINNPTGFVGSWGEASIGGLFNQRNRFTRSTDGAIAASLGLGDPEEAIGFTATLSVTGLSDEKGAEDNLGAGSISLQAGRMLPENFAVSVGVQNLVDWEGAADDTGRTFYGAVSKVLVFSENINDPFSLGFVTVGVGNGVFRTLSNLDPEDELGGSEFNVFGSFATQMGPQASAIAEWTGQDLTVGFSVVPFKTVPLVTSFGLNDLTGNSGDGVRLNFGITYGFSF